MRSSVVWVLVLYGSSVILLYAFKCCGVVCVLVFLVLYSL